MTIEPTIPAGKRRFPITPGIIGAVATQTLRQCVRRKVLFVLVLWLAAVVIGSTVIPRHEPVERFHALVSLCLRLMSFFGVIVAVFLAATVLPEDRRRRTISTLMTKPVGRLNYLLGRVAGFALTLGLILLVMGVAAWGFLRLAGASAQRESPGMAANILVGKRGLDPTEIVRHEGDKTRVIPETRAASVPGGGAQVLVFAFRDRLSSLPAGTQHLEMIPTIATGGELPRATATITIRNPKTGRSIQDDNVTLDSERLTTVDFPASLVHPEEGVEVALFCHDAGVWVRFAPGTVQIETPPVPFEWAFAKAVLLVFLGLVLVVVVSVTASTFLSAWVAVLLAFTAYFFSLFQDVLVRHMAALTSSAHAGIFGTGLYEHVHGPVVHPPDAWYVALVNKLFYGGLWTLTHMFPDFDRFSATTFLTASRDVPATACLLAAALLAAYALGYLILAQIVFKKRELMP